MRNQAPLAFFAVEARVDRCRAAAGCGSPVCGKHAVGKPVHQIGRSHALLVVGEAPSAVGWWLTARAFHERTPCGPVVLSRTGRNLERCLAVLGLRVEDVFYVEAVKCRPARARSWRPDERTRRQCRSLLEQQILALKPRVVLALGSAATMSCLEIAGACAGNAPRMADLVGSVVTWRAVWGECAIVPLYHPSSANNGRWPRNVNILAAVRQQLT